VAHQAGACPGFHSMKQIGVSLLPPGWDASPSHLCCHTKMALEFIWQIGRHGNFHEVVNSILIAPCVASANGTQNNMNISKANKSSRELAIFNF